LLVVAVVAQTFLLLVVELVELEALVVAELEKDLDLEMLELLIQGVVVVELNMTLHLVVVELEVQE
jgi:hypothetical protein